MKVFARELFESGRPVGRCIDPGPFELDDEPDSNSNVRIIHDLDAGLTIIKAERALNVQHRGEWSFKPSSFFTFAALLENWDQARLALGGYLTYPSNGPHSKTYYWSPGQAAIPSEVADSRSHFSPCSSESGAQSIGNEQEAVFTNSLGHPIAKAFDRDGLQIIWTRYRWGSIRGRALSPAEQLKVVEYGLTIAFNLKPEPEAYLVLSTADARLIREVAQLVGRPKYDLEQ